MQIFQTIYKKIDQVLLKLYAKGWIHYINGPQTLPAPLGREEEQAIFEKLQTQESSYTECNSRGCVCVFQSMFPLRSQGPLQKRILESAELDN